MVRIPTRSPLAHPGAILNDEFLQPMNITQTELADRLGVSFQRINGLVNGKRGITPDTALRLSKALGTTPDLWMNLQKSWDLWHTLHGGAGEEIERIQPFESSAA